MSKVTIERINPDGLFPPPNHSAVHVLVATGSRTVYVNGQVARDADGNSVGVGDHVAQARQAFLNLKLALAGVGASGHDIVQYRITVVGHTPELGAAIRSAGREVFGDEYPLAASITVGATSLGRPEFLVEVEAIANLD